MKTKLNFALLLFVMIATPAFSQRVLEANVVTKLEYGSNTSVYFLYEPLNSEYYKTVVTEVSLEINELIRIWIPANEDSLFLVQDMNDQEFYAKKVDNPNSQLPEDLSLLLPVLNNEILFFDSPSHLAQLYQLTEDQAYESDSSFQVFLNEIEELYGSGFVSYRTYFNNKYPITESYRDNELDQMEKENFISDAILNTYFNQYRLMGFSDSVYYYHNREEILAVHMNNVAGIDYLKSLARMKDDNVDLSILTGVAAMDLDQKEVRYVSKKGVIGFSKGLSYSQNPLSDDHYYKTIPKLQDISLDCIPYRKAIQVETWYGQTGQLNNTNYYTDYFNFTGNDPIIRTVTLKINWGDGSPIQIVNNHTDRNDDAVYHDYPAGVEATYYIQIETVLEDLYWPGNFISIFDGQGYNDSQNYKFSVGIACTGIDKQAWKEQVNPSGSWKMKMSGWINHNMFGNHIGGYTHAYKKQDNGSWKLGKADIKIEVEGTFRHATNCTQTEFKSGSKQHNNDKKIEKTKTKVFTRYQKFGNGDVKTKHRMIQWGVTLTDEIVLNPCQ